MLNGLSTGRTSMAIDASYEATFYRLAGFRVLGQKAVRVDILERLADFIRPALSWRFKVGEPTKRPEGAWDGVGFMITTSMLSILASPLQDPILPVSQQSHWNQQKTNRCKEGCNPA